MQPLRGKLKKTEKRQRWDTGFGFGAPDLTELAAALLNLCELFGNGSSQNYKNVIALYFDSKLLES